MSKYLGSAFLNEVRLVLLAGLSTATSTAITTADSILSALGKLQAQITLRAPLASPPFTGTIGGTADFSGVTSLSTGSTARSLSARFSDVANVKDFGAKGDGVTNDTTAIQAALNSSWGLIYMPPGAYIITSALTISRDNVVLCGAGNQTTLIQQNTASADILDITGISAQVSGLTLAYGGSLGSAGVGTVALNTASLNGRFQNLNIYNVATGIRVYGGASGAVQFFNKIQVQYATSSCFWVDNTTDTQISQFVLQPGGADAAGASLAVNGAMRVTGLVEAFVACSGSIFGGLYSLATTGSSLARGSCPAFCNFTNVFFDSSASLGLFLNILIETTFTSCWIAGGRVAGLPAAGAQLSSTIGIKFVGCQFIANGSHGLVLNTGAVGTLVEGCSFDSNGGSSTSGTADGIAVVAGVTDFVITGNRFGNGVIPSSMGGGTMGYGVRVFAGASDRYVIRNNLFDSTLTVTAVSDSGTGTQKDVVSAPGGAMSAADLTFTTDTSQTAVSGAWTLITPAIAPAAGSFTAAGATLRYKKIGRTVMFSVHGTITTPGTGTGGVNISMPFAPAWDSCFAGREIVVSGKAISGELFIGTTTLAINYYDNNSIIAAGVSFTINGVYEATS